MELSGVYNIMATPFDDQSAIDEDGLRSLTEFQISAGAQGLTLLGIMGEAHKLLDEERLLVTRTVIEQVKGRIPVVVGVSSGGVDSAIWLSKQAQSLGAAGVMSAPPANLRNLDAVFEHFRRLSQAIEIPVIVQDEPIFTGVEMPAAFLARLCNELDGCRAIKLEDAPTPPKITQVRSRLDHEVPIFGGLGGAQFYYELQRGACGTMTGFAFTEILVAIHRHFADGDETGARDIFFRYLPLIAYEAQPKVSLALRKELLRRRGAIRSAALRHPGVLLDKQAQEELDELLAILSLEPSAAIAV
jgi:4-hydroxy-tetrahydrodipicolinate synthase